MKLEKNPSEVGFTAVGFAPMASWLGMLHPHIRKHMALWKETHHTTEVYNMVADSVMNQASWQGQMDASFEMSHMEGHLVTFWVECIWFT